MRGSADSAQVTGWLASNKWWAHQDLNLGLIDYESPGDFS